MTNPALRRAPQAGSPSDIIGNKARIVSDPPSRAQPSPTQLLAIFKERCMARALLVAEGMMPLQDAVDTLQQAAVAQELVDHFGQDEIQHHMADAFKRGGR